jgi:hypothetical protein
MVRRCSIFWLFDSTTLVVVIGFLVFELGCHVVFLVEVMIVRVAGVVVSQTA